MKIGEYFLGQEFGKIKDELSEISIEEYNILKPFFKDEKIYHGKDVEFLNEIWSSVIGITNGAIYKINCLKTYELPVVIEDDLYDRVRHYFVNEFGFFFEEKIGSMYATTWKTTWGNIILNYRILPVDENGNSTSKNNAWLDITLTSNTPFKPMNFIFKIFPLFLIVGAVIASHFMSNVTNFILFAIIGIYLGKKADKRIGAYLIHSFAREEIQCLVCFLWSGLIASLLHLLIKINSPGTLLTILGYLGGLYISCVFYKDNRSHPYDLKWLGANIHTIRRIGSYDGAFKKFLNIICGISFIIISILLYLLI